MYLLPGLPTCLGYARDIARKGHFANLGSPQSKLTKCATRTPCNFAAIALARWIGISRQFLQCQTGLCTFFLGTFDITSDSL